MGEVLITLSTSDNSSTRKKTEILVEEAKFHALFTWMLLAREALVLLACSRMITYLEANSSSLWIAVVISSLAQSIETILRQRTGQRATTLGFRRFGLEMLDGGQKEGPELWPCQHILASKRSWADRITREADRHKKRADRDVR